MFRIDSKHLVFSSLFTALIIVGGFISIPIGLVPVTLADFFVMVSASLQNPLCAFFSIALYIALGLLGLPVFANGKSGLAVISGPTSGFLLGYVVMTVIISTMLYRKDGRKCSLWLYVLVLFIANCALYALGVVVFSINMSLSINRAFFIAVVPFIPGTILKSFINYFIYKRTDIWRY